jgi:hypothetical protein
MGGRELLMLYMTRAEESFCRLLMLVELLTLKLLELKISLHLPSQLMAQSMLLLKEEESHMKPQKKQPLKILKKSLRALKPVLKTQKRQVSMVLKSMVQMGISLTNS